MDYHFREGDSGEGAVTEDELLVTYINIWG